MSRRIDIELTSSQQDGSWTWRAAGAKNPKGVLDGSILPSGAKVGDELKLEIEQEIDGITVLGVVEGKAKETRPDVLEMLPSDKPFEAVIETRAKRDRNDRDGRRDGGRDGRREGGRKRGGDGGRDGRREGGRGRDGDRGDGGRDGDRAAGGGRQRSNFAPPPEVPQRAKPKRLRPGKTHRAEVLNALPEEQRSIAELALQGMPAVRQRLKEENARLSADGKAEMPEATVIKLAEDLLPKLRVAEWQDRAEAATRQIEHLDLRDLRSVVAASDDPMVARDASTRQLASELKNLLVKKQEHELALWLEDIDVALNLGRVIRALRLSSQPPKAGVPFPSELATKLADATNESLAPTDGAERWSAVLEAAAFSPIRAAVLPATIPDPVHADLTATVTRLGPLLPQVALLFGITVPEKASTPKPLRPNRKDGKDGKGRDQKRRKDRDRTSEPRADKSGRPKRDGAKAQATALPVETPETGVTAETPSEEPPTDQAAPPVVQEVTEEPPTDQAAPPVVQEATQATTTEQAAQDDS